VALELRQCLSLVIHISSRCASTFSLICFERRETSSFGQARLDRLREELTGLGGPEYDALYGKVRERGDRMSVGLAESPGKPSAGFATYRVDHDYELFGELSRKIPG
jgi:hypothetical protein